MDGYSRLIAWLKVVLPLMALGLLSTLFLLSRETAPDATIPFAQTEIEERLRDQQVTGSFFSGTTEDGDQIVMTAERLRTADGQLGENEALNLTAQIDTTSATRINIRADLGRLSVQAGETVLEGNVRMRTSTGFTLNSALLTASLDHLDVKSPGPVDATSPFGTLEAGGMELNEPEGTESPHLFFTNGVKLVYEPKEDRK